MLLAFKIKDPVEVKHFRYRIQCVEGRLVSSPRSYRRKGLDLSLLVICRQLSSDCHCRGEVDGDGSRNAQIDAKTNVFLANQSHDVNALVSPISHSLDSFFPSTLVYHRSSIITVTSLLASRGSREAGGILLNWQNTNALCLE